MATDNACDDDARREERLRIARWLRRYADEHSGSHPANAGHIACNAAASELEADTPSDAGPCSCSCSPCKDGKHCRLGADVLGDCPRSAPSSGTDSDRVWAVLHGQVPAFDQWGERHKLLCAMLADVRRETIEACRKVTLDHAEWLSEPGRVTDAERKVAIGALWAVAKEMATPKGSADR